MKCLPAVLLFPALLLMELPGAHAASCSGASPFGDVAQDAIYCSDALWAKNAGVTLGCTLQEFCPNDAVTRAQMVLFLRRTAEAGFPAAVQTESSELAPGSLGTGLAACTTLATPHPGTNEQLAHVIAVVSLQGGAANADVQLSVSRSAGGGPFS